VTDWFCLDCRFPTQLNKHGYCARCGSDGVAPPTVRTKTEAEYEVELLERLYERSEG
jgi:hypothetical protein